MEAELNKKPRVQPIEPYSDEWEKEAGRVARDFVRPIYPCKHCNHPVITGYCCTTCRSIDP